MRYILITYCLLLTSVSSAQYALNNDAVQIGTDTFQLAQDDLWTNGSVWYKLKHDLDEPFTVSGLMNFGNGEDGADGMVFVMQNSCLTAGNGGGGIGYGGMTGSSIGIEFDTFDNEPGLGDLDDPTEDHIAIHQNGNVDHGLADNLAGPVQMHASQADVEDSTWYSFEINYDPTTTTLDVYFDGTLRISHSIDIKNDIFSGDEFVYWGFTGATGGLYNSQNIYINPSSLPTPDDDTICSGSSVNNVTLPPLDTRAGENLAAGKTSTASSELQAASNAFDGNMATRWESTHGVDPSWIAVDLGNEADIDSVILQWEGAYASEYHIETSPDGTTWTSQYYTNAGDGGEDKIIFSPAVSNVRYVRMYGLTRPLPYGYSLWEFEVYGELNLSYEWTPNDGSIDDNTLRSPTFSPTSTTTYSVDVVDDCLGAVTFEYTVTVDCPMPVEFLSYEATSVGGATQVSWQTASEKNSDYFIIFRSNDGTSFEPIAQVNAAGNSNQVLSYSILDEKECTGVVYYQIKEVDIDGTIQYSDVFTNACNKLPDTYNNIVFVDELELTLPPETGVHIYDLLGRTLYQGYSDELITVGKGFAKGIYIVELNSISQGRQTFKIEKL